jgi:hypothetical protein
MVGAVDGADLLIGFGCSTTQRKPHLGQNLDLCGRTSRQCGHSVEPQFLQYDWLADICEWQTEHRAILDCILLSVSDYFGASGRLIDLSLKPGYIFHSI